MSTDDCLKSLGVHYTHVLLFCISDFVSEEDIIKAENDDDVDDDDEDHEDEEEEEPTTSSSPRKQAKMKVKLDLPKKKKKPEKMDTSSEQQGDGEGVESQTQNVAEEEEPMEEELPVDSGYETITYTENDPSLIRKTVGKTVTVTFQSTQDQPRGVKRKAASMDDEVVIVGVKGPKSGKQWKPFKKNSPSPATTPKSGRKGTPTSASRQKFTPASASSSVKRRGRPSLKVQLTPSPKKKVTPKSANTAKRGRPGRKSGGRGRGRGTFLKTLGVVKRESNRYEDDEFVYFDDDEEDMLEDNDEIIVVRSAGKRGRPKKMKRGSRSPQKEVKNSPKPRKKTTEDSTPIRMGGMKMPIVLLTRTDVVP